MKKLKSVLSLFFVCCIIAFSSVMLVSCGKRKELTSAMVNLSATEFVYDGTEKQPKIVIVANNEIVSKDDYSVIYENNVNVGTASVNITANGNSKVIAGSTIVYFNIISAEISAEISLGRVTYNGQNQVPNFALSGYQEGVDYTLTWEYKSILDYAFRQVDGINFVDAGMYKLTITGMGNYSGTKTYLYEILPKIVKAPKIEGTYNYTGTEQTAILDYTSDLFEVSNNKHTDAGSYYVIVSLKDKNNYVWENQNNLKDLSLKFEILSRNLEFAEVSLEYDSVIYSGEENTPSVNIVLDGKTLVLGTDYNLNYYDNTNVGTARVEIIGIGECLGQVSKTFEILPQIVVEPTITGTYTYSRENQTAVLSYTSNLFEVSNDTQINAGSYNVTISLKDKSNYIWAESKSSENLTLNFVIERKDISDVEWTFDVDDIRYTGSEIKPSMTALDNLEALDENVDYTISLSNNVNVGTAKIQVLGIGNYTGSIERTFEILPQLVVAPELVGEYTYTGNNQTAMLSYTSNLFEVSNDTQINAGSYNVTISLKDKSNYIWAESKSNENLTLNFVIERKDISDVEWAFDVDDIRYTGSNIKPSITALDNLEPLNENVDYTISLSNNVNVGTAKIQVLGIGNYNGNIERTFEILPQLVSIPKIVGKYTYTGESQTVVLSNNSEAIKVVNNTQINAGTYVITVSLKDKENYVWENNSTDDITLNFIINKRNIENAIIEIDNREIRYTGSEITPSVVIKLGNNTLEINRDYALSYTNNINAGEAQINVTANGNYTGNTTSTFVILPQIVTEPTILGSYTYTGEEQTARLSYISDLFTVSNRTYVNAGRYMVTVSLKDKSNYVWETQQSSRDLSLTFEIYARSISSSTVTLEYESINYSASENKPSVIVSLSGKTLALNTDYTVRYSSNINAGTASAIITGTGNYTGRLTKTFEILKIKVNEPSLVDEYKYNGALQIAKLSYLSELFSVSNASQTNAGEYSVIVSLKDKNNYVWSVSGTSENLTLKFIIEKADYTDVKISRENYYYGETPSNITLSSNVEGLVTYYYSENNDLSERKILTAQTILNSGKYYIYAEVQESQNFNAYTTTSSSFEIYRVDLQNCEITLDKETYQFTGLEIIPNIEVRVNGRLLNVNDYDVNISNNIDIGTGYILVSGKGNYYGSKTRTFSIIKSSEPCEKHTPGNPVIENFVKANRDSNGGYDEVVYCSVCLTEISRQHIVIEKIDVSNISVETSDVYYTGNLVEPKIVIENYEIDKDYTLTISNNKNVGTASVKIQFIGNYDDTFEYTFEILPQRVITPSIDGTYTYNGNEQTIKLSYESELFIVANRTQTNAGKYNLILSLIDKLNYVWAESGTSEDLSLSFEILPVDLTDADITIEYNSITFTGNKLEPKLEVKLDENILSQDIDYTIAYENNINAGTANITIRAIGNYKGILEKTFEILKVQVEEPVVKDSYAYNEAEQTILRDTEYYVVTNATLTNAGRYNVVVSLRDKDNYIWKERQNSDDISFVVVIEAGIISEPEIIGTFIYNGKLQTALIEESEYYTVSNNSQTDAGRYTIIVSLTDKNNYVWQNLGNNENLQLEFVIEQADINDAVITIENNDFVYSGNVISPSFNLVFNDITLEQGTDYVANITNNINAGDGKIIITGLRNFKDTKEVTFEIKPLAIDTPEIESVEFDGNAHSAIQENSIYTANESYTNAGTYDVELELINKNNYMWSETQSSDNLIVKFNITPRNINDVTVELYESSLEFTGNPIAESNIMLVRYNLLNLVQNEDYELEFKDNVKVGTASIIFKGIHNFAGEKIVNFEITPMLVDSPIIVGNYIYNGELQTPEFAYSSDLYNVSNSAYRNAGKHYVTASLNDKDNYSWKETESSDDLQIEFYIQRLGLAKPEIIGEYAFNGEEITANILNLNENIKAIGGTQTNAGNHSVVVSIINTENCVWEDETSDDITLSFIISSRNIAEAEVTLESEKFNFTGDEIYPNITLKFGNYELIQDFDYIVSYENNINVGTGTISITGINNFVSSIKKEFSIVSGEILESNVTLSTTKAVYNGTNLMPSVTIEYLGNELIANEDYEMLWYDAENQLVNEIVNSGTYTLEINGLKNYTSNVKLKFVVDKADYQDVVVTRKDYVYGAEKSRIEFSSIVSGDVTLYYSLTGKGEDLTQFAQNDELDAGKYYLYAKVSESANYNEYITLNGTMFTVLKADRTGISVYREDYKFGRETEIQLIGYNGNDVKYYYYLSNEDISTAREFTAETILDIGNYSFYAEVLESTNYNKYLTEISYFAVSSADYESEITVSRAGYTYGEAKTPTIINGYLGEMSYVKFYFNLSNTNVDGTLFDDEFDFDAGTYYIYAVISANGNYSEYITQPSMFVVSKANYSNIYVERDSYTYGQDKTQINLVGEVFGSVAYYYNKEDSNENGIEFNINTDFSAGTYYIYAVVAESDNYNSYTTKTTKFKVNHIVVQTPSAEDIDFTGFAQTLIAENENYIVTNNVQTNANTYNVVVSLRDTENYIWSESKTSEDLHLEVSILAVDFTNVNVTLSQYEFTFDGTEKTPTVNASLGYYALSNLDYSVKYLNNVNSGTANVVISANENGNFVGEKVINFDILKADYSDLTLICGNYSYGIACPAKLSKDVEGEVSYYISKNLDSFEILDLDTVLNVGTYQVYAVVDESENFNRFESKVVSFEVIKALISNAEVNIENYTFIYTGNEITPNIQSVVSQGIALIADIDFEYIILDLSGNKVDAMLEVGEYTLQISGKGNYEGSLKFTLSIVGFDIEGATVSILGGNEDEQGNITFDYTGYAITPEVVVKLGDITLNLGTDYSLNFRNNSEIGTATIIITGQGAYNGQLEAKFNIVLDVLTLENATISQVSYSTTYSGANVLLSFNFDVYLNGMILTKDVDYVVIWTAKSGKPVNQSTPNLTDVDEYTGTIKAVEGGIYEGTASQTVKVTITARRFTTSQVKLSADSAVCTGSDLTPGIKLSNRTLKAGTDYSLVITNSSGQVVTEIIDVGTYTIKITGTGNYSGSVSKTFTVTES